MNKRLLKRHKRQVSRARDGKKPTEPDLRTPEQLTAAREASRSVVGRADRRPLYSTAPPNRAAFTARAAVNAETGP